VSEKYAFIAAECAVHREGPTIALMCMWLGRVEVRLLRVDQSAGQRGRAAPGTAEDPNQGAVRVFRRRVRIPAHPRRTSPGRRTGR